MLQVLHGTINPDKKTFVFKSLYCQNGYFKMIRKS